MAVSTDRVARVGLFAGLPDDDLARLSTAMTERTLPIGAVVAREADLPMEVFAIESGRVAVSASGGLATFLEPGDVFGEIGAWTKGARTANVVAVDEVVLLVLTGWDFRELAEAIPVVGERVRATITERLAEIAVTAS